MTKNTSITFEELRKNWSPEHRKAVEDGAARLLRALLLKDLREKLGFTKAQVAQELSISENVIENIENRADLTVSELQLYIDGLGGDIEIQQVRIPVFLAHWNVFAIVLIKYIGGELLIRILLRKRSLYAHA